MEEVRTDTLEHENGTVLCNDPDGHGEDLSCVNENLTEEEEALDVPHITINRKRLRTFLDLASKIPNRSKDHCKFVMFEADMIEVDGKEQPVLYMSASDNDQVSTIRMEVPVLNSSNVFMDSYLVLKHSTLSNAERLIDGDNFTLRVISRGMQNNHAVYDVSALIYGGWISIPQGAFTPVSFTFQMGSTESELAVSPSDVYDALRYLVKVAATQHKEQYSSVLFQEDCAFVEDLGGYVRYDGHFFTHRVPLWTSDIIQRLISTCQPKTIKVSTVRDKVSGYPHTRYEGDGFDLTFTRFGKAFLSSPVPSMSEGVRVDISTLRNIAHIPLVFKTDLQGYFDGSITLEFKRENGTEQFTARLGGKSSAEDCHRLSYEVFGDLRNYCKAKLPAQLMYQFLDSCRDTGMVSLHFDLQGHTVSMRLGKWTCQLDVDESEDK